MLPSKTGVNLFLFNLRQSSVLQQQQQNWPNVNSFEALMEEEVPGRADNDVADFAVDTVW